MKRRVSTPVLVSCIAAGAVVVAIDARAADQTSSHPPIEHREPEAGLADKSGWYAIDKRKYLLLTPSARGGWFVADFENLASGRIELRGADSYVWNQAPERTGRPIRFVTGRNGRTRAFVWRDKDGNEQTASKQPDHGCRPQEVFFKNGKLTLSGLLFTPQSDARAPAAVMIHGSGASDRDNVWYQAIANHLATQGIAVLLPDKRGTGKSQGDWQIASFEQFARDALAAAECLKPRDDIDPARIGLLGISQGGWIAPLAASLAGKVAFVVNVSGAAVRPNEQLLHEVQQTFIQRGGSRARAAKLAPTMAGVARSRRPIWWKKNGDFDPIPLWESLPCPGLIIYGQDDQNDNVPVAESTARLQRAIATAKHDRLTLKVYPDSGHGLRDASTGNIRQDFLDDLSRWIAQPNNAPANR